MHLTRSTGRTRALAVGAVLAAAALLGGCSSDGAAAGSAPGAASVAAGTNLDADGFAALVSTEGVVVVDVRTPEEFAAGHLPGAVNIDVTSPDGAARLAELDPATSYAVYCRSGNRSAEALRLMRDAGVADAAHLLGGIGAWSAAGGEVVTG